MYGNTFRGTASNKDKKAILAFLPLFLRNRRSDAKKRIEGSGYRHLHGQMLKTPFNAGNQAVLKKLQKIKLLCTNSRFCMSIFGFFSHLQEINNLHRF